MPDLVPQYIFGKLLSSWVSPVGVCVELSISLDRAFLGPHRSYDPKVNVIGIAEHLMILAPRDLPELCEIPRGIYMIFSPP